MLMDKVDKLERSLLMFRNQGLQRSSNLTQMKCYNCNGLGHMARNCKKRPVCKNCGLAGHISENCRKKRRANLRNFVADDTSNISEPSTAQIINEGEDIEKGDYVEYNQSSPVVYGITKQITNNTKKSVTYPRCIENWSQFIDGNGNRPKKQLRKTEIQADYKKALKSEYTCISSSNSEPAKHKPIINGKVAGINKNILLDTGAETNVMDLELLKELNSGKNKLKIFRQKSTLKCANGSSLFAIGYSVVPVTIGNRVLNAKFTVVEKIFPRIILGMNFMRKFNIVLEPSKSQISYFDEKNQQVIVPLLAHLRKTVMHSISRSYDECP